MKFFPTTQIDRILEKISQQEAIADLNKLFDGHHSNSNSTNDFDFDQLDSKKIFHLEQIRKVSKDRQTLKSYK